ncbi:MAG: PH domain-containing protein [bacterium]|nr:PH domain-containing protein [bacterium]MDD5354109.1 PH domain-containing protein [bacterium]
MEIAWSKTRKAFPLSTKKIIKKTVSSLFAFVMLYFAILIIATILFVGGVQNFKTPAFSFFTIVMTLLMLLAVFISYMYQKWYFSVYFYDLGNDYICIRKGPITPQEINIPYERIQDIYIDQDLLDRFFGLYDVHLSSATISSGIEAHIDGVEKEAADGLRVILLRTVQERISKHKGKDIISGNSQGQS